jgi:hypothetical protein
MNIYLIGSLRNPEVPKFANRLRASGFDVFDDWYCAGPRADDHWQEHEEVRGHTFLDALKGYPAAHVFEYDRYHLMKASVGILMLPAGKSGHLELGFLIGQGKPGYILLDRIPERWDVMYRFADKVFDAQQLLIEELFHVKRGMGLMRAVEVSQ